MYTGKNVQLAIVKLAIMAWRYQCSYSMQPLNKFYNYFQSR